MTKKHTKGDGETTCLVCGETGRLTRGLCKTDYSRFSREMKRLTPESAERFEREAIARGMILDLQKVGRKAEEKPFEDIVKQLGLEYSVTETAKQHAEQAKAIFGKNIKPKSNTSKRKQTEG